MENQVGSDMEPDQQPKKSILSISQRQAVYQALLTKLKNDRPAKGSFNEVAQRFNVNSKTISRIWKQANASLSNGELVPNLKTQHKPKIPKNRDITSMVTEVPLSRRTTLRSLAAATGVPTTTLWRKMKEGAIRRHSNSIKPLLTEENRVARLKFCLSMMETPSTFGNMYDVVHVDEKWFYMTKASKRFYLAEGESEPLRSCKSKRFIEKVMFLAAVARPRYDPNKKTMFPGKMESGLLSRRSQQNETVKTGRLGSWSLNPLS